MKNTMLIIAVMLSMNVFSMVTNLNDYLYTQITYTNKALDVKSLEMKSIKTDNHKNKWNKVTKQRVRKIIRTDTLENVNNKHLKNIYLKKLGIKQVKTSDFYDTKNFYVIDNSKFSVTVDEDTFKELDLLKLEYEFRTKYGEDEAKLRLKDLLALSKEDMIKWITVFNSNATSNITYIPNKKVKRLAAEIRLIDNKYDQQLLLDNLAVLQHYKYEGILVRFDCSEDINILKEIITMIKSVGFTVYCTYCGKDAHPHWNPLNNDSEKIEAYISEIAKECEGCFLNWRGMSNHITLLPIEFFNFMCNTYRKHNSKIAIYGEVYYGTIGYLRSIALMYTVPENVTGVVINNMGFAGYNHAYIANNLFSDKVPNYNKLHKIGQVIGALPYYASKDNQNLSFTEEYDYKKQVEDSFNGVRCSTVTMIHDGVDDFYVDEKKYDTTDDILYDTKLQEYLQSKIGN